MEHEGAAEYAFKHAQSLADLTSAAAEYEKALLLAPWNAGDYYNLGSCYAKADDPRKAIAAYQFYLLAAPGAKDADEVVKQIGALKYQLTQKQQQHQVQAASDAAAQARRQEEQRLEGHYVYHMHSVNRTAGIDADEIRDVQQGEVTAGENVLHTSGSFVSSSPLGYHQSFSGPLTGNSYHIVSPYSQSVYFDGVISDDGSSITETQVKIFSDGTRDTYTYVFRRQ